jgi:hypothetical protein
MKNLSQDSLSSGHNPKRTPLEQKLRLLTGRGIIEALSQHLPGGTDKTDENPQSE